MVRRGTTRRRGVALVEAVLGGVMLAVGLAVLVSIVSQSLSRQRLGEEQIVAASLIDELLNMVLVEGPDNYGRRNDLTGTFEAPFEDYSYQLDIRSQGEYEPYSVIATVRWNSAGVERQATVETMIAIRRADEQFEPRQPGETIVR